jgi:peptidoglycan hydrolase-like protein with peptidoglycan-binding domain
MQARLAELGYYEEKDNGYFGVATERAVKSFQKRNKIEETGVIDQASRT